MSAVVLSVHGLAAYYGRAQALFDVTFGVAPGEVLALIGRNGAGKSTLLKGLIGLVRTQGEIMLDGLSIAASPPHQRARRGLGYVPEERRIFTDLTVRENLRVGARGRAIDLVALLRLFPNLEPMLDRSAAQMSGGEQQMLALARVLAAAPRVVLLDEPSEGIAPKIVDALAAALRSLKAEGATIVLSEQNARFVAAVADRALLLEHGHIVGEATHAQLSAPSAAVSSVLGLG